MTTAQPKQVQHAHGEFEVQLSPLPLEFSSETAQLGRLAIDKSYHGDLQATAQGQMLSALAPVEGSGVYVAIESIRGTLGGRQGSFVLAHQGTMRRGAQQLTLAIVPDTGAEELTGLAGTMTLTIVDGKHAYSIEYWFEP